MILFYWAQLSYDVHGLVHCVGTLPLSDKQTGWLLVIHYCAYSAAGTGGMVRLGSEPFIGSFPNIFHIFHIPIHIFTYIFTYFLA
jgi:hypothetical protein